MSCPKKLGVGCLSFRTELHAYSRYQYFCYWHHFALVSPLLSLSIHLITVSIVIKKFCILVKVAIRIMKNLHHAILFSIYFHDNKLTHCLWGSGCLWALKYLMGFSKEYLSTGRRVLQLVGKHADTLWGHNVRGRSNHENIQCTSHLFQNAFHVTVLNLTGNPASGANDVYCHYLILLHQIRNWVTTMCPSWWSMQKIENVCLTHWGRVTHICVSKITTIIGSDNGFSPGRRQAIIWTSVGILLIGSLGTNFSEILIEIYTFSFQENAFEYAVWKMAAILSRLQCVKRAVDTNMDMLSRITSTI